MGSGVKSLFSGGSRSITHQLVQQEQARELPQFDTSLEALDEREAARRKLPVLPLRGDISVVDRRAKATYHYDLSELAARFPAHAPLILQLMAGALPLAVGKATNSAKHYLQAIIEFIEFLNAPENLSNTPVALVGDVNLNVCRAFTQRLLQRYPTKTDLRKIYGALRRAVQKLQTDHAGQPGIGKSFDWPKGPVKKGNTKDGYTPEAFIELSETCLKDIREVMRLHAVYDQAIREGKMILLEEWNLPNLMFYLSEKAGTPQLRPLGEILARILQPTPNARRFMKENGLTKRDVVDLYQEKGVELASQGVMPGTSFTPVDANQKITVRQAANLVGIPYQTFTSRHTAPGCPDPIPIVQAGYRRNLVSIGDLQKHYPSASLLPKPNDWNSLPNFMHWLHWHATQGGIRFRRPRETMRRYLDLPTCKAWMKANGYSLDDIITLYETRGMELAQSGRSPFAQSFPLSPTKDEFEDRLKRLTATLAIQFPDYPYNMDYKAAREFISDKMWWSSNFRHPDRLFCCL